MCLCMCVCACVCPSIFLPITGCGKWSVHWKPQPRASYPTPASLVFRIIRKNPCVKENLMSCILFHFDDTLSHLLRGANLPRQTPVGSTVDLSLTMRSATRAPYQERPCPSQMAGLPASLPKPPFPRPASSSISSSSSKSNPSCEEKQRQHFNIT